MSEKGTGHSGQHGRQEKHGPQTSTWVQVAAQTTQMNMALGSSMPPDVSMSSGDSTLIIWACFSHCIALHLQFHFSPQCRDHSAFLSLLSTMYYISPISHGGCLGILYYFSHNVSIMLLSNTLIEHENQNVVWNPSSKMDF